MADNLQDFLRKAAERRAQQQAGQSQTPQATPQAPPLKPIQPQRPAQQVAPGIEIYESEPVSPDDVVRHVQEHLDTSGFQRRAANLGHELGEQTQDDRLHEVFDHNVGRLSKSSVTDDAYERADKDRDYMVDDTDYFEQPRKTKRTDLIAGLMRSPQSLRQAFIFSEIIKPLSDPWES